VEATLTIRFENTGFEKRQFQKTPVPKNNRVSIITAILSYDSTALQGIR
jgi:hypothetical protein